MSDSTVSIQNDALIYRDALIMIIIQGLILLLLLITSGILFELRARNDCKNTIKGCDCNYCWYSPNNCSCNPINYQTFENDNKSNETELLYRKNINTQLLTARMGYIASTPYELAPECKNLSNNVEYFTNYDALQLFPFVVSIVQKVYVDSSDNWRLLGTGVAISDKWFLSSQFIIENKFWKKFFFDKASINVFIRSGSPFWSFGGQLGRLESFITRQFSNVDNSSVMQEKLLLGSVKFGQFKSFYSFMNVKLSISLFDVKTIDATIVGWHMYNLVVDNGKYVMLRMWDGALKKCSENFTSDERCLDNPAPRSGGFCLGGIGNVLIVDKHVMGIQIYPSCYNNQTTFLLLSNYYLLMERITRLTEILKNQ